MADLFAPNDIARLNKLVETLVAQLTQNQETMGVLRRQIEILKGLSTHIYTSVPNSELVAIIQSPIKAAFAGDKEARKHMQLATEYQVLKHENHVLSELLDAYEQGLNEIMSKIRTFMVDTVHDKTPLIQQHDSANRTLQLHRHYRAELSRQQETLQHQQKSYLDLQAGLYKINALVRQAYTTNMPEDPAIEALQSENRGLREMLRLSYRNEAKTMNDTGGPHVSTPTCGHKMANEVFLQPCSILYPEYTTGEHIEDKETAHTRRNKHAYNRAYGEKKSKKNRIHPFLNLMHGKEADIARDYRYSCFCSESEALKKETNILHETMHLEMMHALREFVSQRGCLSDGNKIPAAIMHLGTQFSGNFELYTRITELLEDCIHGPIVELHGHQTTDIKMCFKQIINICMQFSEKMALQGRKMQLRKDAFAMYCDYDPECLIQWYEEVITYKLIDQNILEKKSLKVLDIQYFDTKHPKDTLDIAIEKLLIASQRPRLRLGPHLYNTLLNIHQRHSYGIEYFISAIEYIILSHFYSNPISIVNYCDSVYSELISHHHLECLRSLPSIKQYTESLFETNDIHSVESLLNNDYCFRDLINSMIRNMEEHNERLHSSMLLLNNIFKKYTSSTRKKALTWIYGKLLENNIQKNLNQILSPIKMMDMNTLLHFIEETLTFEKIHNHFSDLENFYKKMSNIVKMSTYSDPIHSIVCEIDSYTSTKPSVKIAPETNIKIIETEFFDIKEHFYQYLWVTLTKYLISPITLPLHELYYFNYSRTYLDVFHPRVRAAIDTALSLPSHYLSCNCKDDQQTINNNVETSQSKICISCQPKICISYKLFLESGPLINISDWFSAFVQSVNSGNKQNNDEHNSEKYLQTAFIQSIEELRYLGFIRPTKKKTDHVAKITWMRFLLRRSTLNLTSSCDINPLTFKNQEISKNNCWYPSSFNKAIVIIIDALRYDFTIEIPDSKLYCHNRFTILHETVTKYPEHAFLKPFIADPPTTTLQRLKALTTGTLPTFIDAGSNFAGVSILEDNIIAQLKSRGYRIGFLGDNTWISLYPRYFEPNITYPFDSFNVWDLDTVDNNINSHLFPLLTDTGRMQWDILIAHYLGLDHSGHKYGPNHNQTARKLVEMDITIRKIMDKLQNDTLLIVFGDHGMDTKGDHGGDSLNEITSAFWMYHKKAATLKLSSNVSNISQLDFVPTFCLLMGIPIPYNNLGSPILEAFFYNKNLNWKSYSQAARITTYQIKRYIESYKNIYGLETFEEKEMNSNLKNIEYKFSQNNFEDNEEFWKGIFFEYITYQHTILNKFRKIWTNFDISTIVTGIIILFGTLLCQFFFYINSAYLLTKEINLLKIAIKCIITSGICLLLSKLNLLYLNTLNSLLFGLCLGSILNFASFFFKETLFIQFQKSFQRHVSIIFIIVHGFLLLSNSFIIWEDKMILFVISSIYTVNLFTAFSKHRKNIRIMAVIYILLLFFISRITSSIRQCREEQQPFCQSTFYNSENTTVSSNFSLTLVFIFLVLVPQIISRFLTNLKIYKNPISFWIFTGFKIGLLLIAMHSILDSELLHSNILRYFSNEKIKNFKIMLVKVILFTFLFIAHIIWIYLSFSTKIKNIEFKLFAVLKQDNLSKTYTHKSGNIYGSNYLFLVLSWFIILTVLQKPSGIISFCFLLCQILLYLELLHLLQTKDNFEVNAIIFALLGRLHFFSTGHQATLSSIQWDSAFLASKTIVYPLSPALVLGNTFGSCIFTTIALPLLSFWKREFNINTILNHLFQIFLIYILYYSVMTTYSILFTTILRRHLMVWKIFAPKYMANAVELLSIDSVLLCFTFGLTTINIFHLIDNNIYNNRYYTNKSNTGNDSNLRITFNIQESKNKTKCIIKQ
ncbi:hypothetical protein PMAC_001902 [Pneumocystis sp. 'macacae']|nr:hypothetical protein PMAC_001902 [Pneumocystis sp. 'macacae']